MLSHDPKNIQKTQEEIILPLAQRLASSTAEDVLLLEHHDTPFVEMLLRDERARRCLLDAGFKEFLFESDTDSTHIAKATIEKSERKSSNRAYFIEQAEAGEIDLGLRIRQAGFGLVTASEVLEKARKDLERPKLLAEVIWNASMAKQFGIGPTDTDLFYFQLLVQNALGLGDDLRPLVFQLVSYASDPDVQKSLQSLNGMKRVRIDKEKVTLYQELQLLQKLGMHYRFHGKCDAVSAEHILKLREGRSVIVIGAGHGIRANNPASLPDQLQAMDTEINFEILQMIAPPVALRFYKELERIGADNIRQSAKVYDVMLKEKWSVLDWMAQAPKIYRWPAGAIAPIASLQPHFR